MTTLDQNIPCDLIMGFSLDMLIDLINHTSSKITINGDSVDTISPSYKYAFKNYFQTKDDKVIAHPPHGIKIIDYQHLETIAWGTATLRGSKKSYILKLSHHYAVKYVLPDSSNKNAAIQLDYNGTEIYVVEGGKLDAIPIRMIRQAIQTIIKQTAAPKILLNPPTIDIPFADVAVDLQRLTINCNKKIYRKNQLYFEVAIDDRKYMLGRFEVSGNTFIDLNLTYLLRKQNSPLHISIQGVNIGTGNASSNILGSATISHNAYNPVPSTNFLIGKAPRTEWKLFQDLINANIKHTYNGVQTLISPILKCFGNGLKKYEEVNSAIANKIYESFLSLKPNYAFEYSIRRLDSIDISLDFLGLSLNPETNSFCLKFNYIINGIDKSSPNTTTDTGFVYPYGLGIMINENLLKRIFKAYWDYSYILPKTFCTDYNKLIPSKGNDITYSYSLNINSAELFINPESLQIVASIKTIGNNDKSIVILKRANINNTANQCIKTNSFCELKNALTKTDLKISKDNKLNITLGKIDFDIDSDHLTKIKKLSNSLIDNLTNIYSGTKINLLNFPKEFVIDKKSFKLTYNYTNVNPKEIIIGSKINGLKKSAISPKPALPPSKKEFDTISLVPKDKWGYEGTANGHFNVPCGIAINETEERSYIYAVDRDNNRVQNFDANGKFILKWGDKGSNDGQLDYPNDLSVDKAGYIYVVDVGNNRIQKFDPGGGFIRKFGSKGKGNGNFFFPQGIAVDNDGSIYVTDTNHLVQKFDSNCKFIKQWGGKGDKNGKYYSPRGIALDNKGFLYVVDAGNHRIQKFNTNGTFISKWGSKGTDNGQFCFPQGLALDNNENVYVTDTGNNRIQKFDSKGKYITKVSSEGSSIGQFLAPFGIAIDKNGDIYVTDSFNNRIQKLGC